jgi:PAS domain S-box-containing protein
MSPSEQTDPIVHFARTKRRIVLVLLGTFVLASIGGMAVLHPLLQREFLKLEADEGIRHWYRASNTLKREASSLMTFARDWATWDDMYNYVHSKDPEFEKSSLSNTTFDNLRMALIAVYDEQGRLVWGQGWDPTRKQACAFDEFLPKLSAHFAYLSHFDNRPAGIAETTPTSRGLMIVTSLPILKSDGSGPRRGFLVMARAVDKQFCADVGDRLGLSIDVQTKFDAKGDVELANLLDREVRENSPVVDSRTDRKNLAVFGPITGDRGQLIACLKVETDRAILVAGREAMLTSVVSTISAGLVMLVTVFAALRFLSKALRQIERSERRFRALAEETKDAIIRVDAEGRCIYVNPSSARIFSLTPMEVLGKTLEDLPIPFALARALKDTVQQTVKSRETRRIDCESIDGQWMDWLLAPEIESDGSVSAVILSGRDITDRVRAESEITKARDLAEQASQMKSRFVSNVSHEIRTPMNGVVGCCEMILSASSLKDAKSRAAMVLSQSEILLQLVNDLLDSAKMEQGKLTLDARAVEVRSLVLEIKEVMQPKAEAKQLSFEVQVKTDVPEWIKADGLRLKQILINLISNAIKFTERGHITVCVDAEVSSENRKMLCLSVEDTGIGIPEDKQQKIFEAFTQADISTTRKYGGTGLGTTIVRDLAHLMGGSVGVKSEEGKGSTFSVSIPLISADIDDIEQTRAASLTVPPVASEHPKTRARILLVEDYPINREIVVYHLSEEGHEIVEAGNGRQAVDYAESSVFDLILMDLHMPVMDGFEAAKLIRKADSLNAATPIVALTASAESSSRQACIEAGMDDVVTKPVRARALLDTVNLWLNPNRNSARSSSFEKKIGVVCEGSSPLPNESTRNKTANRAEDSELSVFDARHALDQFGGNEALLRMTLEHLIRKVSSQIHVMRDMAIHRNGEGLRAEAHKIKGGASSLCAMRIAASAAYLEDRALKEQPEVLIRVLDEMEQEVHNLEEVSKHT